MLPQSDQRPKPYIDTGRRIGRDRIITRRIIPLQRATPRTRNHGRLTARSPIDASAEKEIKRKIGHFSIASHDVNHSANHHNGDSDSCPPRKFPTLFPPKKNSHHAPSRTSPL